MNIIDVIPKICKFFPGATALFLQFGLVLVSYYHSFTENVVVNTAFEGAKGLEKVANVFLIPSQYLCDGQIVEYDGENFKLKQQFQYKTQKKIFSPFAITFFTPGTLIGSALKGIALFNSEVKERHIALKAHIQSKAIKPHTSYYAKVGINAKDWREGKRCTPQGYKRRPGDENNLASDKEALAEITTLLTDAGVPFWVDCGTCIGAYRYGGVIPWDYDLDLSILEIDFQNAKNALRNLNPQKFQMQDWSSRGRPGSYIRVYVKDSHNHIDVYCNAVDEKAQTVTYIISHIDSAFMAEDWKERERRQITPIPFDVIFPLKKGIFDGIEVPVPNQTARFLQYKYGENLKPSRVYSEKTGEYEKDLTHPYWDIPLTH